MVKLKLQILLIPEEFSSLPTTKIDSLIAKKYLHLIDSTKQVGELLDAVVAQFKRLYPDEPVVNVIKCQDKNQCDLDPDYQVDDVFEPNDEVRVVVDNLYFSEKLGFDIPPSSKRSLSEMEAIAASEIVATPSPARANLHPVSSPVSLAPPPTSYSNKIPKKREGEGPGGKDQSRITSGMLSKPPTANVSPPNKLDNNDNDYSPPEINSMESASDSDDGEPINNVGGQTPRFGKSVILDMVKKSAKKKPASRADPIMKSLHIDTNEGHPFDTSNEHKANKNAGQTKTSPAKLPPTGAHVTLAYKKKGDSAPAQTTAVKESRRRGRPPRASKLSSQAHTNTETPRPVGNASDKLVNAAFPTFQGPSQKVYEERTTSNILDSLCFNLDHMYDQVVKYRDGPNGKFKKVPKHFAVSAYSCPSVYTDPVVDFRIDLSGESNYNGPLPYPVKSKSEFDRENGLRSQSSFMSPFDSNGIIDEEGFEVSEAVEISSEPGSDDDDDYASLDMKKDEEEEEDIKAPKRRSAPKTPTAVAASFKKSTSTQSTSRQNTQDNLPKGPRAITSSNTPSGDVVRGPVRDTKSKSKNATESGAKDDKSKQKSTTTAKNIASPKTSPKKTTRRKKTESVTIDSDDDNQEPTNSKSRYKAMTNLFANEQLGRHVSTMADTHHGHESEGPKNSTFGSCAPPARNQENEDLGVVHGQQQSAGIFSSFVTDSKKATEESLTNLFFRDPKPGSSDGDVRIDSPFGSADPSVSRRVSKSAFGAGDAFTNEGEAQESKVPVKSPENGGTDNSVSIKSPKFPLRNLPTTLESPKQSIGSQGLQLYASQADAGKEVGVRAGAKVEADGASSSGSSDVESVIGDEEEEEEEKEEVERAETGVRLVAAEPEKRKVSPGVGKNTSRLSTLKLLTSIANQRLPGSFRNGGPHYSRTHNGEEEPTQVNQHQHNGVSQTNVGFNGGTSTLNGFGSSQITKSSTTGAPIATAAKKPALPTLTELGSRGVPEVKEIDALRLYKGDNKNSDEDGNHLDDSDEVESVVGGESDLSSDSDSSDDDDDDDDDDGSGSQLFLSSSTIDDKSVKKRMRAKKNLFTR
ncbi:hypothetical protein KGF57_004429 [Candida theae]|uniref:Nucleolar protein Dnt1-like N-terminal domain-containing protein n=1 Tax=Candida theae TaxID=1198502 RepID=A0AAD5BB57_9ASCO|nr:uncharacterized protein KGF57_004429 [Candida theae]KAI5950083.1 hypothetical protein KGF57_004429 [Candida theae]